MKIFEFFQDATGQLSSARLGMLLIVTGFFVDWMAHVVRAVQFAPEWSIISIVAGVMGIKVIQKQVENNASK